LKDACEYDESGDDARPLGSAREGATLQLDLSSGTAELAGCCSLSASILTAKISSRATGNEERISEDVDSCWISLGLEWIVTGHKEIQPIQFNLSPLGPSHPF